MNVGAYDMSLIFTKRVWYSKLCLYILLYSQSVNTVHFIRSLVFAIGIRSWSLQIHVFTEIGKTLYSRGSIPRVQNAPFKNSVF